MTRIVTPTRQTLIRLLIEGTLTQDRIGLVVAYFRERGIFRPKLAQMLDLKPSYVRAITYKSKPITQSFCDKLLAVLLEKPLPAKPHGRKESAPKKERLSEVSAKTERSELLAWLRHSEPLSTERLTLVVDQFVALGVKRPALAAMAGISYSHLSNVLGGDGGLSTEVRARLAGLLELVAVRPAAIKQPQQEPEPLPVATKVEPRQPSRILLQDYASEYFLEREVVKQYAVALRCSITSFSKYLRRPATVADLNAKSVNRWLVELCESEKSKPISRWTVRGRRQHLVALWNAAYREDPPLIHEAPQRVRAVRRPRLSPDAWTPEEVQRLLSQADALRGVLPRCRISRRGFWRAYILCGYDTGLRMGDLLRLSFCHIGPTGVFSIVQSKTCKPKVCRVWPETLAAIASISTPARPLIFGEAMCRRYLFQRFQRLVTEAGLAGSMRKLRRTSGTLVESLQPGAGHRHLGNAVETFNAHYLDQRFLVQDMPLPPRLSANLTDLKLLVVEYLETYLASRASSRKHLQRVEATLSDTVIRGCGMAKVHDLAAPAIASFIDRDPVSETVKRYRLLMIRAFVEWLLAEKGLVGSLSQCLAEINSEINLRTKGGAA